MAIVLGSSRAVSSAYVFIDAAQIREWFDENRLDWRELNLASVGAAALQSVDPVWQGHQLVLARTFVYDAIDDATFGGDPSDGERYREDVRRWLERTESLRDTHVRRGYLAGDPRGKARRQKGVDVQLAVDALGGAAARTFEALVLVSGDGDFVPLLDELKRHGVMVGVSSIREKLADEVSAVCDRVGLLPTDPADWEGWNGIPNA